MSLTKEDIQLIREVIRDEVSSQLKQELNPFKEEMYAFRNEMYSFRDEMYRFQEENRIEHRQMRQLLNNSISNHFDHEERIIKLESKVYSQN